MFKYLFEIIVPVDCPYGFEYYMKDGELIGKEKL